ncbi:hypothetical protein SAMN04488074_117112 [Lentzea albidocapillata subsp. violacea]|uniref:Uncharacterized protein n=1 Tax=Lentzea albidocapillata subsp. violacea TaxID=128104 RepID=A0A1G9QYR7_9PSEU|nr:hypothetical protein [Lentzea albidocapillata]SDM16182.1 hypothetical protein SAMN04488074_117112 [Lentzea albidocapillata subsp. violacea]
MSGRKRIYVDEGEWNRLRQEAGKLAELKRDMPKIVDRIRARTQADIETSMREVDQRHARFEQAMGELSEHTREVERETARRMRENSDRVHREMAAQGEQLRAETSEALRQQQENLTRAIDRERRERERKHAEIGAKVEVMRAHHDRAERIAREYVSDAKVLRDQVAQYPHERYLPDRFTSLEARLTTLLSNVDSGLGAHSLSAAQELCLSFSELRLDLDRLDQEWRTCRIAAERDLVRLRELLAQNEKIELRGRLATTDLPDVDHWSRGALSRLATEVDSLLAQVRDDAQPMTTEALLVVVDTVPEYEQRLETVVTQAVTAMQAAQLRTNLAELIAGALDHHHHYQVTTAGFASEDQRETFLAKSVHHVSGSEIVIEVEPGERADAPPLVRLHNFDADGASEAERAARTKSIHRNVLEHSGIDLRATEEFAEPDDRKRDIEPLLAAGAELPRGTVRPTPGQTGGRA